MKGIKIYASLLVIIVLTLAMNASLINTSYYIRPKVTASLLANDISKNGIILNGANSIANSIKLADRNNDKIHDLLNEIIANNASDIVSVIVLMKKESEATLELFKSLGGTINKIYTKAITGFSGKILAEKISVFARDDNVIFIQPNLIHRVTMYNALKLLRVRPYIWENYGFFGPSNMSIAVIDSGIDSTHPMFLNNSNSKIIGWFDAVNNSAVPYDDNGHGTIIAGIIGGNFYDAKVIDGKVSIQFEQLALIIDGLPRGTNMTFSWWTYFPVFEAGSVNITIYWEDISVETDEVKGHQARILSFDIALPDGQIQHVEGDGSPLSYEFHATELGSYYMEININMYSNGTDEDEIDGPGIAFWAFAFQEVPSPDEYPPFAGVAPAAKLVGVKVLDSEGYGSDEDILEGIEWVIENKIKYHIVAATITFGSDVVDPVTEQAVKNLILNGIVVISAAGNNGPEENTINSPARLDYAIAVGATTDGWDSVNVTNWSSRGPYGRFSADVPATGNTTKPDIVAPGGDFYESSLICVDSNLDDNLDIYVYDASKDLFMIVGRTVGVEDIVLNDLVLARGTSMATAYAGGAVMLLIQALTNDSWTAWGYSLDDILKVKQILLMTAWEIYRGKETHYRISRGEKDPVEGFGLIQVDAALDAVKRRIHVNSTQSGFLSENVFKQHVWAGNIYLEANHSYMFRLEVPSGADMDLYLWDSEPNSWGEPFLMAKSAKSGDKDEYFVFTPSRSGYYYVTIKIIEGEGTFKFSVTSLSKDEIVELTINPGSGSIVESGSVEVFIRVHVNNSYVTSVKMAYDDEEVSFVRVNISEDGRISEWKGSITLKPFSFQGEIIIITPVTIFTIQYSLTYIPYFTGIIVTSIAVVGAGASYIGYRYYRKKKLERLARIEEEAEELAKEAIEEILEEETTEEA